MKVIKTGKDPVCSADVHSYNLIPINSFDELLEKVEQARTLRKVDFENIQLKNEIEEALKTKGVMFCPDCGRINTYELW